MSFRKDCLCLANMVANNILDSRIPLVIPPLLKKGRISHTAQNVHDIRKR
ncbi:MAG: hypothetical protein OXT09_31555 [Myxococcales bacterium]|nr:hypothetical protein [Myxococcales bacterium]